MPLFDLSKTPIMLLLPSSRLPLSVKCLLRPCFDYLFGYVAVEPLPTSGEMAPSRSPFPIHDITSQAQVAEIISEAAEDRGMDDPKTISPKSEELVLNTLWEYSGITTEDPKKLKSIWSVGGIINGLRHTHIQAGHIQVWSYNDTKEKGSPLEMNPSIRRFRNIVTT